MGELLPWVLGALLGSAFLRASHWRAFTVIAFAVSVFILGIGSAVINGEWLENPGFGLVDIGQVALSAWIAGFIGKGLLAFAGRHSARMSKEKVLS